MSEPSYASAPYPVRPDVAATHQEVFRTFARPGTWWSGEERLAIAAEARAARECGLCRERKAAVSPFAVDGEHDGCGALPAEVVDVVHRLVTDPGRLGRSWYEKVMAEGVLGDAAYVELVSITAVMHSIDVYARALGVDAAPLPAAEPGEPSRERPASARVEGAWVPQIPAGEEGGEEWRALYGDRDFVPQIGRALSLVPSAVNLLQSISGPHYMELDHVGDPGYSTPDRDLDRLQMELIASRVSALNECFY